MKKSPKKQQDTGAIEELAQMSQREFSAIREQMATKDNLVAHTQALMNRMDAGFGSLEQTLRSVKEDVRHWKEDIIDLQERMARLEKHLGVSKGRHGLAN